jgi:hypothetical protein
LIVFGYYHRIVDSHSHSHPMTLENQMV